MHLGNWRQTDDSLLCLKLCSLTVCVPSWTPAASAERAARQAGTSHLFLETAEKRLERWKWGDTEWVNRLVCCFILNLLRWACTYYDLSRQLLHQRLAVCWSPSFTWAADCSRRTSPGFLSCDLTVQRRQMIRPSNPCQQSERGQILCQALKTHSECNSIWNHLVWGRQIHEMMCWVLHCDPATGNCRLTNKQTNGGEYNLLGGGNTTFSSESFITGEFWEDAAATVTGSEASLPTVL